MRFDDTNALAGLDLTVDEHSIVAVMGPSGCGKSTLLRVIAGLQKPDRGIVTWRGETVTDMPTHRRGFGLMFQDYALFPHRTVAGNVAFGLRMARWTAEQIRARVDEILDIVGLAGFGSRHIDGLSGGEQQRVALARTLAPRPSLVMLDEPLGSLDRTLRDRLLVEMRDTFTSLGVTAIYVTHDQDEAFTIGQQVAVMAEGAIVRQDTPQGLWTQPGTAFVASFVGHENVLSAAEAVAVGLGGTGNPVLLPSEALVVAPDAAGSAIVVSASLRGGRTRLEVEIAGVRLVSSVPVDVGPGDRVAISISEHTVQELA